MDESIEVLEEEDRLLMEAAIIARAKVGAGDLIS